MKKHAAGRIEAGKRLDRKALESLQQIEEKAARQQAVQLDEAPAGRWPRSNYSKLRAQLLRWLSGDAGSWYAASDLQREFPELEEINSVAMFLKAAVDELKVKIDKTRSRRNTSYSAAAA